MRQTTTNSSWVRGYSYLPVEPEQKARARELGETGDGLLVIATDHGRVAWLTPSWVAGLMAAAQTQGRSLGRFVNRVVRGKYPSVKIN